MRVPSLQFAEGDSIDGLKFRAIVAFFNGMPKGSELAIIEIMVCWIQSTGYPV